MEAYRERREKNEHLPGLQEISTSELVTSPPLRGKRIDKNFLLSLEQLGDVSPTNEDIGRFYLVHQYPKLLNDFRTLVDKHLLQTSYGQISDALLSPTTFPQRKSSIMTEVVKASPSILKQPREASKEVLTGNNEKGITKFLTRKAIPSVTYSPSTRSRMKKVAKRSPHKKAIRRKSEIAAKKKLAYTEGEQFSVKDLLDFTQHEGFTAEERKFLRKKNTLGYGSLTEYGWRYSKEDAFDRSTNAKLRNFLILKLGQQDVHAKTYSEIYHYAYVEVSVGAEFYDDVFALIEQTNLLVGVQEPNLLADQENKYFRVNSGGAKQLGMPITTVPGMESDFYSLIMAFSDIEVVLDTQDSPKYRATSPVYLKVESKKMLLINHDVCFWYPANNTRLDRRWVEFKIMAKAQNGQKY